MMKQIILHPIGVIHSPYKESKDIPIQGKFKDKVEAWIELKEKYVKGLKDLEKFSHAIILFYFHKSDRETIEGKPYLENNKHGIFAIRSPHRPNHIGLSIVKIKRIQDNKLYFTQVDMIEGTPVLDIKPYVRFFDNMENAISGWLEKHFQNGKIPNNVLH
jgi:tRNA-Thr(GGU) m(6)t(6)A37 methyltransferase TsaA